MLLYCLVLIISAGCGGPSMKFQESQSDTELFEHAKTLYEQGEYRSALEYFIYVKENFLRSDYAGLSRFYAGQCYFELEKFDEAVIEYRSFLSFFPNDPNSATAQYRLGVSLFEQALGPDQDQSILQEAFTELLKVAEKYPEDADDVQNAETFLKKVRDRSAEHEYRVARFYRKEKRYKASKNRVLYLMKEYPGTSLYDDALYLLALNYLDLGQKEEGKACLLELLENYPAYEEREKARKRLGDLGEIFIPHSVASSDTAHGNADTSSQEEIPQKEEPIVELSNPETPLSSDSPSGESVGNTALEGYVVLIRDDQVFLNLIREDGVREGMVLEVLRDAKRVGVVRVLEIQEGFSLARIESIESGMTIREDDIVRVLGDE